MCRQSIGLLQVIIAHNTLQPCDTPFAWPCQPTCVLQTDFAHSHNLPIAFVQAEPVASAAQGCLAVQECCCISEFVTMCRGGLEAHTTSPLTASLLVSMYHRFTASVTTMLSGVRNGACSSEGGADWADVEA